MRGLVLLFLVFSGENAAAEDCKFGWTPFGVECFKFFPQSVNWITAEEKQWLWTDGSPFDYTNWCNTEPNNQNDSERCLELNYTTFTLIDFETSNSTPNYCWNLMTWCSGQSLPAATSPGRLGSSESV
ncbi:hypothetical protein IRJ41_004122 [Triplophysa rosa]|uniref:C-type lectin domain-containing protein n=1 Tax=Triplophysa rosa TaxID=992332 RepID=A0A9W7T268_TRIRA|nr:hypothetical protein IRJ41_004122 [Triplophysa rosa]